jgi:tRNA threonylcarbamoyladenosine biosynthesis protein TsaE
VDLVLVPGLRFDLQGNRLGFGKGYFDRFLPRVRTGTPMLALAYEMQMKRKLPSCPWDYSVSAVVTERRTFRERSVCWVTKSEAETGLVGEALGRGLLPLGLDRGSLVIGLIGPLGAGKTCLVRGLARGVGCLAAVSSPTFTLEHEYPGGQIGLRHLDLYRLTSRRSLEDTELFEERFSEPGVTVVEWAERWLDFLPLDAVLVEIEPKTPTERRLKVSAYVEDQHPLLDRMEEIVRERRQALSC